MHPGSDEHRVRLALILAAIIGAGLVLRFASLGLPPFAVKYGGSALWGAMVYVPVQLVRPEAGVVRAGAVALAIAIAVELSRLIQLPWLDAFRLTLAGQLLLGRIFSLWNIAAYAAGILVAAAGVRVLDR